MKPTSVFVGGLGDNLSRDDLEREFSKYGKLNSIWVAQNPPGFAFIEYDDDRDADEAIKNMNGVVINGSRIRVEMSRGSGRGGRGGRGRGRGGWRDERGRGGRGGMRGRFRGGRDSGFGGRGGFGRRQGGGYDSYRSSGQQSSGGWGRRGGSRMNERNDYDAHDDLGGDYSKGGSNYRSRSPVGQRYCDTNFM
ncbi:RNA-binding protein Rsf1-like isoform X1 [Centruroides vittatus]|uniref:RNA-binding protein Rsf1-like isoform X1 n=1 Tax=Centruroides sculpturatus TaxID=218467 RepID=UPI000C6EC98E|nr:RNA-binding protein Rsf1-like isoform X1 [Centruroides sculpturatus]